MTDDEILRWETRAKDYTRRHNWHGARQEDLVQTILLLLLEKCHQEPAKSVSLSLLYLQAREALNPRHMRRGRRRWISECTVAYPPDHPVWQAGASAPEPADVIFLAPETPRERHMWALYFLGDYRMEEIGDLYGVTASYVSQLLRRHLPQGGLMPPP